MKVKVKIGDVVKVTDSGCQYTTYVEKAVQLGADISSYIMDFCKENQGSFSGFDYRRARDRNCKWIYDNMVQNGDVCMTINIDGSSIVLIERIYDGRQFLMDNDGLKVVEKSQMFSDGDFLL